MSWDYTIFPSGKIVEVRGIKNVHDGSLIWTKKRDDGITDFERLVKMGEEDWELVNAIPISTSVGTTDHILFILKRRRTEEVKADELREH